MIFEIVSILAPVFICVGIVFVWARSGGTYDIEVTTQLIMLVGAPCLVFSELASLELLGSTVKKKIEDLKGRAP